MKYWPRPPSFGRSSQYHLTQAAAQSGQARGPNGRTCMAHRHDVRKKLAAVPRGATDLLRTRTRRFAFGKDPLQREGSILHRSGLEALRDGPRSIVLRPYPERFPFCTGQAADPPASRCVGTYGRPFKKSASKSVPGLPTRVGGRGCGSVRRAEPGSSVID